MAKGGIVGDRYKTCPFCGSRNLTVRTAWDYRHEFVTCRKCEATGPRAEDTTGAWDAWNSRREPKPDQMRMF